MKNRKIVSCLALLSIIYFLSCYGVSYKDKNDSGGLSNEDVVQWMEITTEDGDVTTADADDRSVTVSWECPINSTSWSIAYSETAENGSWKSLTAIVVDNTENRPAYDITIYKTQIPTDNYRYEFKHKPDLTDKYLVYYKIIMNDANNQSYENIVPYVVYPQNKTLRITIANETESSALSDIYGSWDTVPLFTQVRTGQIPSTPVNKTLSDAKPIYFWIKSDFSFLGLSSKVLHYSNSSYCKVTKLKTPGTIPGKTVLATLEYSFEDFPRELVIDHTETLFDYNDIVFTVDIY